MGCASILPVAGVTSSLQAVCDDALTVCAFSLRFSLFVRVVDCIICRTWDGLSGYAMLLL